jgi:acylphosphatase
VGFRYTARKVAGQYKVAGFVRNLPDGRVEMVLEGHAADLHACLADLAQRMARYIEHQTMTPAPATGEFGDPAYGALKVV